MSVTQQDIEKIREYTRKDIPAEEIYTFPLILCDNEIDRDGEKFTAEALGKLAELFRGKTGIFDHNMSSKDQTARIYETEVIRDPGHRTADGEIYTYLSAKAYMLRSDKNNELIAEIDAGIKKETSVGCSVDKVKCSICGRDMRRGECNHIKGRTYSGKKCAGLLCDPLDAYEWSFVAVPAQRNAGVTKSYSPHSTDFDIDIGEIRDEYRQSVISDAAELIPSVKAEILEEICDSLPLKSLKNFRNSLRTDAAGKMPLVIQLAADSAGENRNFNEYRI
ncbi:MAG: hypothetical protein IKS04_03630 [Clostridia bacterium]|nr:hypothetical protein [Clostridia bacterium]